MSTAVREMHAFEAAAHAGREPYKVRDLSLAEFGRKEIRLAEQEMPGLMALRARYKGKAAARRRPHHGQPAHDHPDGGAHRDARRSRRRRALGVVQHLLDPGSRRGRGRGRPPESGGTVANPQGHPGLRLEGRDARGVLVVHERGADVAGRLRPDADRRRRRRRDAAGAQGRRVREGGQGPGVQRRRASPKSGASSSICCARSCKENADALDQGRRGTARRQRGDDHRRAPPLPDAGGGHAAVPGDQRQRLGHQEQVRQHLRLPPLGDRRPQPRHRRHARRQGRGGVRLRRSRQGLRAGAARPGLPRHRHRNRSDLRAAGGDGRLRGQDARGRRRDAPTSSSPRPATSTSSPPSTWRR